MPVIGSTPKGFIDTKSFRLNVLQKANLRLGVIVKTLSEGNGTQVNKNKGLLSLLDSTYKSDVPSTIYALHLKAIAFESARFLVTTEKVKDDIIFQTTRGEYFSQNIASFLFPNNNRFAQSDSTDEKVRNFYLSIVEAYFGGSTKTNIEKSLLRFIEIPVEIVENFLTARINSTKDEIINKFTFDILVQIDDPRIKDLNKLQSDIKFLLDIIKPAHTSYQTKFIFSELYDTFRKGCILVKDIHGNPIITHDGFETKIKSANTAICDTFHIDSYDYYYEDFRKKIVTKKSIFIQNEILQKIDPNENDIFQASPRVVKSLSGGLWQNTDKSIYHTKFGPLGNRFGDLAINLTDVTVYINGIPVNIVEIYPLSGAFKLSITPNDGDIVTANYYYLKEYTGALITNDFDSVINNYGNQATEFKYKTVLYPTNFIPPTDENPLVTDYKYEGFDLFNSSILNDPLTLNLNELGLRNKFNDYYIFKSFGFDSNLYSTSLTEGETLVPVSLDKKDVWRRLPYQELRLNNTEFIMNNPEDRMFGEIHYDSYHPFYSALELYTKDNGGKTGLISSISEDETNPMTIEFQRIFEEEINKLGKEYENQLYTYPSVAGYWYNSVWVPPAYNVINDPDCILFGGNATWDIPNPGDPQSHFGGTHPQMHILVNDIKTETYPRLTLSEQKLWDRNINENPWYRQSHLVEGSVTPVEIELPSIYPIHIDDIKKEFYKEENIFTLNTGILNQLNNIIWGSKLKESDIEVDYVTEETNLAFRMNSYISTDIVSSIGGTLNFLTLRKVLTTSLLGNQGIIRVTNSRGGDYDLTGMTIINNIIIKLDASNLTNISIGYQIGDVIEAEFEAADHMNQYDQYAMVYQDPSFVLYPDFFDQQLITRFDISSVLTVTNHTKSYAYDLTDSFILGNKTIFINKNNNLGKTLDSTDIVFAEITTVAPTDNPAPTLTYYNEGKIIIKIEIHPV